MIAGRGRAGSARALRIAVPPQVAGVAGGSGHGNVWRHVLERLPQLAQVQVREWPPRLPLARRPDVWLADGHSPPPDTGGAPLAVVVHEASWADPELARFLNPDFARAMAAATEAAVGAADAVLTGSGAARDQIARVYGVDPARIHAIPYGVDLDVFRPEVAGGRERVGAPYVLFVGVIHPRKNLDALRQAIAGLAAAGYPHVLAIVGSPARDRPDPAELTRAAGAELPGHPGRVRALGAPGDEELAALYCGADAFCLPSWFEGFGLPALEAMACGTPVVVSDRGALPEVVGDAGIVVAPDAGSVQAGLERVLAARSGERAAADDAAARLRARAEAMPWSRTVAGWHAVLGDLAAL